MASRAETAEDSRKVSVPGAAAQAKLKRAIEKVLRRAGKRTDEDLDSHLRRLCNAGLRESS